MHRIFSKTHLLLSDGGLTQKLIVARPEDDDDDDDDENSVSTHADYRRPKFTIAESS